MQGGKYYKHFNSNLLFSLSFLFAQNQLIIVLMFMNLLP